MAFGAAKFRGGGHHPLTKTFSITAPERSLLSAVGDIRILSGRWRQYLGLHLVTNFDRTSSQIVVLDDKLQQHQSSRGSAETRRQEPQISCIPDEH